MLYYEPVLADCLYCAALAQLVEQHFCKVKVLGSSPRGGSVKIKNMHTKTKGDVGELVVAAELTKNGWQVSFPYGENSRYDLIIEKDGVMKRIQVKAVTPKNGVLHVNCRSSNNWSIVHYNDKHFEVLAVVDLISNKVYYIPSSKVGRNLINLRLDLARNQQNKKINFASNYLELN